MMRGNLADMLPSGWDLSSIQSLAGADPKLMAQREKDFFLCVDGTVFSKEFAAKAQAMKTVSLGYVRVVNVSFHVLTLTTIFEIEYSSASAS